MKASKAAALGHHDFTDRELRNSGVPPRGELGDAKSEVIAIAFGVFVLLMLVVAAFIDAQV